MTTENKKLSVTLAKFAPALEAAIAKGDPAGAVALVWRNGEIVHLSALGKRDIELDLPMRRDTLFRIASMTKPITSVLALMLLDEGKLLLDDPIVKWAPEFAGRRVLKDPTGPLDDTYPAPRDITVEDLLTHRSGFAYAFSSMGPIAEVYEKTLGGFALGSDEFLGALATLPLSYAPGEKWLYGYSTDVLGVVAERIDGRPFRDLLLARILGPLGMLDTDFWIPPEKRDRAAALYSFDETARRPTAVPLPKDVVPKFCSGGGGLVSTVNDYLKFARMLLGRGEVDGVRLLRPETAALMTSNRLTVKQREALVRELPHWEGAGFGLGVGIDIDAGKRTNIGHTTSGAYGWPGAFGTWYRVDPAENMILIYLAQCVVPPNPENIPRIVLGKGTPLETLQKLSYAGLGR
jgi:CubicO group peptidase (beta-lactamase class C family)